jgi:hypothetical protein
MGSAAEYKRFSNPALAASLRKRLYTVWMLRE